MCCLRADQSRALTCSRSLYRPGTAAIAATHYCRRRPSHSPTRSIAVCAVWHPQQVHPVGHKLSQAEGLDPQSYLLCGCMVLSKCMRWKNPLLRGSASSCGQAHHQQQHLTIIYSARPTSYRQHECKRSQRSSRHIPVVWSAECV